MWNFAAEIKKTSYNEKCILYCNSNFLDCHRFGQLNAKPRCQGFNNYDNKVTIVFTDNQAKDKYTVSDVKLIPSSWSEKEYPATSVEVTVKRGGHCHTHISSCHAILKSPSDAPDKWKEKQIQSVPNRIYQLKKMKMIFGLCLVREHVAADESVGTNREGETCR